MASIAFDEPVAVVDGNVKRVLQRLIGVELSSNDHWQMAQELLDLRRPGDFNQAMMELGATICLPGHPICARCPVRNFCASRGTSNEKKVAALRKKATLSYLLVRRGDSVLLRQRPAKVSLMPGMWELPQVQRVHTKEIPLLKLRHSITTTDYSILVYANGRKRPGDGVWCPLRAVGRLPLTGLARKALRRLGLIPWFRQSNLISGKSSVAFRLM